jgi:hypothetical protein
VVVRWYTDKKNSRSAPQTPAILGASGVEFDICCTFGSSGVEFVFLLTCCVRQASNSFFVARLGASGVEFVIP